MTARSSWVGAALAVQSMLGACGGGDAPLVIGVAGPFSQPRGESMRLAAELARDEINRAGGVRGRPLELRFLDDSGSTDGAVSVAVALAEDPAVVAVVGHLTSGATLAAAPVYAGVREPVPLVTPSASSPEITHAGDHVFRVCPSDLAHGAQLGDFAWRELGVRRVAVLFHNDGYGRGVRRAFADRYRALGGAVLSEDPYLPSLSTFGPYLQRLKARGAEAVLVAGNRAEAERILATMDSLGLDLPVLGADGLTGVQSPRGHNAAVYVSRIYTPDAPDAANRAFVDAYRAAFGGRSPDHRGAGAYDIVHLLARGVQRVGADRSALRDYLAEVGGEEKVYDGVLGGIAFDENGDTRARMVSVTQVAGAGVMVTSQGGR